MQTHIHQDLAGWIDASASNALTAEERDRLGRHLANCPRCYGNTADLAILESVLVTLEGRDCFDPGLESRLVQDFRDRNRRAGAATRFALTRKTAVRLTVVTLTAVLLLCHKTACLPVPKGNISSCAQEQTCLHVSSEEMSSCALF